MNQTLNNKFLDVYKKLENILREKGIQVKEYEDSLTNTQNADKLRMCRTVRNYLSHSGVDFISATQEMIDFISLLLQQNDKEELPVKKIMNKEIYTEQTFVKDVCVNFYGKNITDRIPVFDKKGIDVNGIITTSDIFKLISSGNYTSKTRLSSMTPQKCSVTSAEPMSSYKDIKPEITATSIILVKDKNNNPIGWL